MFLSSIHLNVDRALKLPMVFMPKMEVFTREISKLKSYSPSTVIIKPYVLQKVEPIFQPFCAEATVTTGRPKMDTINSVTIRFMSRRLNSVQSWNNDEQNDDTVIDGSRQGISLFRCDVFWYVLTCLPCQ